MKTNDIYNHVERLGELLRVDSRQAGADLGLQPVQLEALHYLSMCNQFSDTPMAVTEYLGQTKGTVSQTLKVLEKKGLISRQADKDDKRVSHLKLTDEGQHLLHQLIPTPMFKRACEQLNKQEQQQINAALQLLLTKVLGANNLKPFGVCHTCKYNSRTQKGYFCNLVQQPLSVDDVQLICKEHEK